VRLSALENLAHISEHLGVIILQIGVKLEFVDLFALNKEVEVQK